MRKEKKEKDRDWLRQIPTEIMRRRVRRECVLSAVFSDLKPKMPLVMGLRGRGFGQF